MSARSVIFFQAFLVDQDGFGNAGAFLASHVTKLVAQVTDCQGIEFSAQ
jgi:hypothetical protein